MILFRPISAEQLPDLITLSYEGDTVGLNTYYDKPCTPVQAATLTLLSIMSFERDYELDFFVITYNGTRIGYFIISGTLLYSFCIRKEYRTKNILLEWWSKVRNFCGDNMTCVLPDKNIRAINFVKRRGMKMIDYKYSSEMLPGEIVFSY